MKKLTLISLAAAAVLFVGCGDKAKDEAAKATQETKEVVSQAAEKTKEATNNAVDATKAAVNNAAEATKEATNNVVDATKAATTQVVQEVKETTAAAATAVDNAVYGKCKGCHGPDGKTKALGKSAIIAGQTQAELVTKIKGYKAGTINTAGMGTLMKGQVEKLTDVEIEAVAAYIATFK